METYIIELIGSSSHHLLAGNLVDYELDLPYYRLSLWEVYGLFEESGWLLRSCRLLTWSIWTWLHLVI